MADTPAPFLLPGTASGASTAGLGGGGSGEDAQRGLIQMNGWPQTQSRKAPQTVWVQLLKIDREILWLMRSHSRDECSSDPWG